MKLDILNLFQDYNIEYHTEGHPHCRPGWVNIECPFCVGNPGYHLGFNLYGDFFTCWRCGGKSNATVIMKLLNLGYKEALQIIKKYSSGSNILSPQPQLKIRRKAFKFPSNTVPLLPSHKQYLEGRGFDPDLIERLWDVQSTGPISHLDKTDYRHRLIIPYFWDNSIVSFQSRDVTDKHMARYMACPSDRELIPHKSILYGKQSEWGDTGICVEGPTDVWRFGVKSFAVSGIKYTSIQVREIAKRFKQIIIIFDPEVQAIIQAYKLSKSLNMRNVETIMIKLDKADPGEMSQKEANYLVKQLIE